MQDGTVAGGLGNAADILSPSSLRVLVCDSKASARQDLVRLLRECSYQVRPALGCASNTGVDLQPKGVAATMEH